jgi:hypothetical protein
MKDVAAKRLQAVILRIRHPSQYFYGAKIEELIIGETECYMVGSCSPLPGRFPLDREVSRGVLQACQELSFYRA